MSKKPDQENTGKRGRKPATEVHRKSRVIQTRVPQDLEDTLKDAAEKSRMTVSHFIRYVLEDTFNLVDGIVHDSSALMENVARDAKKLAATARGETNEIEKLTKKKALDSVDAWQEVIINKPGKCLECDSELKRGTKAFRGLSTHTTTPVLWLCQSCIEKL